MKKYFTDEQVFEILRKVNPRQLSVHHTILDDVELIDLMNLAVETAIGEPVASQVPRLIDLSKSTKVHFSRTKEGMHLTDDELKESINGTVASSLFPLYEEGYYVEDKNNVKHYSKPLYSVKELEN